jgi:O-antigen ligase
VTADRRNSPRPGIEAVVAAHVTVFMVSVSWAFGGNADWVRTPISLLGTLGMALTAGAVADPVVRGRVLAGRFLWALPVAAMNVLVLVSCLMPGFRQVSFGSERMLMPVEMPWWRPSAARPELALRSLWLFDGIYFSCLNLALVVSRRRTLRIVLAFVVGNALVLAVFGTVQKLVGATGIYFGAVKSPQDYFFASFVYDNHWGAFMVLMIAACVGLTLRYAYGSKGGGFFRGPALVGIVAVFMLGLSIPLSGSRACTVLLGAVCCLALVKGWPMIYGALRQSGIRPGGVYAGAAMMAVLMAWGAWSVAGGVIGSRAEKARTQVAAILAQGGLGARAVLYRDTWRMARERPIFGWGMGSYPSVFALYSTQEPRGDRIPVVYHDAHSDWLQSVAEIGFAGTALIGAAVLLPLGTLRWRKLSPIPLFLLSGCLLVALYSWIEFPFGNVAVVLAWWLCFFGAVQYARLTDAYSAPNPAAE